jgi:uncharacterized NAD-dependent epimerase/dehydratase family protein
MSDVGEIAAPYLIFVGDSKSDTTAKTGFGVAEWRRDKCLGQARLPGGEVDVGLPTMTVEDAAAKGARTLIIGIAPGGGLLPQSWVATLVAALKAGLDIASGLHTRLSSIPELKEAAERHGRRLIDVRHPRQTFPIANGKKRPGKRLLTVGTDCAVGKKYTSLVLHAEMLRAGIPATFRATGQTGILITGSGVSVDAIVADFVSGAAEQLSPAAAPDHWDVIEGQGSLFHPSYAGVSLGLLHGSQPDAFVVCHEPTRTTMRSVETPLPSIEDVIELTIRLGRVTNPNIRCVGISINTAKLSESAARDLLQATQSRLKLPATDPIRFGVASIVAGLQ